MRASWTWGLDLIERLRDPGDFRKYFDEVGVDGQMKRIDAVRTALSGDKSLLDNLITQLHRLAEEFRLALNILDIDDRDLLDRHKQLIASQRGLRYSDGVSTALLDHHSELVFRNVYEIMASWSFVKGGMDTDFVAAMIEKL